MAVTIEKLLSTKALADLIGVPQYTIQRAINQDLFKCVESGRLRFVPESDTETVELLRSAAELSEFQGIPFTHAIRLIQAGLINECSNAVCPSETREAQMANTEYRTTCHGAKRNRRSGEYYRPGYREKNDQEAQ